MSEGIVHSAWFLTISLRVSLTIPCKLMVMFRHVRTIILNMFGFLDPICKCSMLLFPTILVL